MKKVFSFLNCLNYFLKPVVEFIILACFVFSLVFLWIGRYIASFSFVICLIYHCFIYLSDEIYELRKSSGKKSVDNK